MVNYNTGTVVLGTVAAGLITYKLWDACRNWRLRWRLFKLPGPRASSLLMGNIEVIKTPIHQQFKAWSEQLGSVYRFRILDRMVVVLTDPETSKYLKPGPTYMPKAWRVYQGFRKISGNDIESILTAPENEYWKSVRRGLAPAFAVNNLKQVFPEAVALSRSAADYLERTGGQAVDIDNIAQRITVDVIGKMVFGMAFNACKFEAYNEPLDIVSNLLTSMQGLGLNPLNRYFPFLEKPRKFRYWCKRYGELAERVVRNAQDCPPPPNSIMASLLSIKDPSTGKPLNLEQLKSEVALLLVAGFETTAHSIAWTLMCLSTHEAAMRRVEEELASLGLLSTKDKPARALDWGDLGRLKFLDAAINESMRLLPVTSSGSGREARDDINVEGHVIPKGAVVMLPTYTIHRNKKVWGPDADEYKPERWLGESGNEGGATRRPGYQPFSLGPRDCGPISGGA
uniref:Cytochrome P450 n=1 Tax=Dunaliella tertiolecta TaxID=3047 RepID=A0A6S8H150_DUNTE|mmetsp:Transcript_1178/g.2805  ORF Transcript_1178/g.2805 Transcript_1178/m.2805 type:complete len:455 (-) Transcript_1178:1055-2419(-)